MTVWFAPEPSGCRVTSTLMWSSIHVQDTLNKLFNVQADERIIGLKITRDGITATLDTRYEAEEAPHT